MHAVSTTKKPARTMRSYRWVSTVPPGGECRATESALTQSHINLSDDPRIARSADPPPAWNRDALAKPPTAERNQQPCATTVPPRTPPGAAC
ncbi:hypothetical protein Lesp02_65940 [Lentzea sp. NBRC 105346]|nr:hypothetical protein Lesp02_65940 [Lentzea sp. NBRC 105346]